MEWVTGVPEEFKTRIRFPMSDREMKRRWSTVQTVMQEQGIDVLIVSGRIFQVFYRSADRTGISDECFVPG